MIQAVAKPQAPTNHRSRYPFDETSAEFKERAKGKGLWRAFLVTKYAYIMRGAQPSDTHVLAMQHFPPEGFPSAETWLPATDYPFDGAFHIRASEVRAKALAMLFGPLSELDGGDRTCSDAEALHWVARKMAFAPLPAEAPSQLAWAVYQWTQGSARGADKFYRMYLPILLRKASMEEEEDFDPMAGIAAERETVGRISGPSFIPNAPGFGRESSMADAEVDALAGQ